MDVTRFVDTSGDVPTLKVGLLASALVGTVVYGWFQGLIDFVSSMLGGLASLPERVGEFSTAVVDGLFGALGGMIGAAWASNAAFIGELGAFGIVVAIAEVALVLWIVLAVIERLLEAVRVITP